MKTHRKLLAATGLIAVLGLAGCWGGSNDDASTGNTDVPPTASTDVPDSAGVSAAAFVSFILGLSASDESSEPLAIKGTFAVPADETAEPTPLT
jgi:hypothetical protein